MWNVNSPFYNVLSLTDAGFEVAGTATPSQGNWVHGSNMNPLSIAVGAGYDATPALTLSSVASGDMSANTSSSARYPCKPDTFYNGCAAFKAVTVGRGIALGINWYTSGGSLISSDVGPTVSDNTSGYTKAVFNPIGSPSNAASFELFLYVYGTGGADEEHLVTRIGVFEEWTDIITGAVIDNTSWGAGQLGITIANALHFTAEWGDEDPYDVFYGFLDSDIPIVYGELGEDVTLSFSDGMNLLAQQQLTSQAYINAVLGLEPLAYWRCNDPMGSGSAADSSGNGYDAVASGQTLFGSAGPLVYAIDTAVDLSAVSTSPAPGGYLVAPAAACPSGSNEPVSIEIWFNTTDDSILQSLFAPLPDTPSGNYFGININDSVGPGANAIYVIGYDHGTSMGAVVRGTTVVNDGKWHQVVVTANVNDSSGVTKIYVDGDLQTTSGSGIGFVTSGTILGWILGGTYIGSGPSSPIPNLDGSTAQVAVYPSILTASDVAEHYSIGQAGFAQSQSGAMIQGLLDVGGVPSSYMDLDVGNSECISPLQQPQSGANGIPSVSTTTVLQVIQQIVATEQGVFYQQPNGVFRFLERSYAMSNPAAIESNGTFENSPSTNLHYLASGFQPSKDQLDVWNDVPVQRTVIQAIGGLQTSFAEGVVQNAQDPTSIGHFGRRTNQSFTSVLFTNDNDSLQLSQYVVGIYAWPQTRVRSIQLSSTTACGASIVQMLARQLIDAVEVIYKPQNNASTFTQQSQIEKISHKITQDRWDTTWMLTPFAFNADSGWFILNHPKYGKLGGPGADENNKLGW